jgi:hypothetical protein
VAAELLAHLADPTDPVLPMAVSSLRRLWIRCKRWTGSAESLDLVADSDASLGKILFGVEPSNRVDEANIFGATLGELANVKMAADLGARAQEVINRVSKHVNHTEAGFVQDLFLRVVRQIAPAATSWADALTPGPVRDAVLAESASGRSLVRISEAFVARVARELGVPVSEEVVQEKGAIVRAVCPTPVFAYDIMIDDVVTRGLDMSAPEQRNSIWDLQIAFSTGVGGHLAGAPVWVITNDDLLHRAAQSAGTTARFVRLDRYEEILDLDWESFNQLIRAT